MSENGRSSAGAKPRADEVDLLWLLRPLRQYWKRFVAVGMLVSALTMAGIINLKPKFASTGSIYLEDKSGPPAPESIASLLPGVGGDADLESQKQIIGSHRLALAVIHKLGLNARLRGPASYLPRRPRYWQWRLNPDPQQYKLGLSVSQSASKEHVFLPVRYTLRFSSNMTFEVLTDGRSIARGILNEQVDTPDATFVLRYSGGAVLDRGAEFELTVTPGQGVLDDFARALTVSGGGRPPRSNNVIHVTFESESPALSANVVRVLLEEFVQLKHGWAASGSQRTLKFVGEQKERLLADMNQATERLSEFQAEVGFVSLEPKVQADLDKLGEFEVKLAEQKMRLIELEQLTASLNTSQPDLYLIAFVQDPLIVSMGESLTRLNVRIAAMQQQFSGNYQPLKNRLNERQELLSNLKATLVNYLERAREQKEGLGKTVQEYHQRLSKLPELNRLLTEYKRSTKVYEDMYVFLFQEVQRAKIAVASTLSNLRIYDPPSVPLKASSPGLKYAAAIATLVGLIVALAGVVIPAMRIRWYQDVEEVKESIKQPVFAIVPHYGREVNRGTTQMIEAEPQGPFSESMRLLRTNLLHLMAGKRAQCILVTSALPGDGKTLISANLATALARSDRVDRILLIDADMHHPSLHGVFGVKQSPGLASHLNGDAELEDILHTVELNGGKSVDLIPAGPVPITPADLIETQMMGKLLDWAQGHYTFTILDTPPFPLVATASILAPSVDRIMAVCRIGQTDRALFRHHIEQLMQFTDHLGVVINDATTALRSYGYGQGYGYAYGYYRSGIGASGGDGRTKQATAAQSRTS